MPRLRARAPTALVEVNPIFSSLNSMLQNKCDLWMPPFPDAKENYTSTWSFHRALLLSPFTLMSCVNSRGLNQSLHDHCNNFSTSSSWWDKVESHDHLKPRTIFIPAACGYGPIGCTTSLRKICTWWTTFWKVPNCSLHIQYHSAVPH